jgi:hypothetical protein
MAGMFKRLFCKLGIHGPAQYHEHHRIFTTTGIEGCIWCGATREYMLYLGERWSVTPWKRED